MSQAVDHLHEMTHQLEATAAERRPRRAGEPEVLPLWLAGNWVAWSSDGLRIVAYAPTLAEAEERAHAVGEPEPIMRRQLGEVTEVRVTEGDRHWAGDRRKEGAPEPEVLPQSLAGNWIAWSFDGLRIVAHAKTLEEAEQLAHAAGEPEPIFEFHPGMGRL